MSPRVLQLLDARRAAIRSRWIELLFVEPVNSPLANPNTMLFMLDGTLDEVFAALRRGETPREVPVPDSAGAPNPYLAYFRAGTQALHEALILIQAETPELHPRERDATFAELNTVIRRLARREIEGFDALCQYPGRTEGIGTT